MAGRTDRALAWAAALESAGILVTPIRPPTVPEGTARLRVTLSASHTEQQIDRLLDALASLPLGDTPRIQEDKRPRMNANERTKPAREISEPPSLAGVQVTPQ
jgi:8-amino-7-oxononanoate synthase